MVSFPVASRGYLRLTGPDPQDPIEIHANTLEDPDDLRALVKGVELSREIGNSAALRPYAKREIAPGPLKGPELETFIRNAASTVWHQCGTAKMGFDDLSVVDSRLNVRGVNRLRVADASILPRVTTGNTMAPCVLIGERAAELILDQKSPDRAHSPRRSPMEPCL